MLPSPRDTHHGWDKVFHSFLVRIGFHQAATAFTADLLVMNSDWEKNIIPEALSELVQNISVLGIGEESVPKMVEPSLEQRKLDYIHLTNNMPPRSQSTVPISAFPAIPLSYMPQINKDISRFLAQNRARNDASNRAEFVYTPAQKRQRLAVSNTEIGSSCARTDAKPLDRDVQMKYDIAKNEEGPLSRTMNTSDVQDTGKGKQKAKDEESQGSSSQSMADSEEDLTASKHPGLDERLRNIETHLAVRYVPSAPRTLLARLKSLEEHLIRLEKDYPPWAALHFNQPNRGWPPPPRQTPIIVPPHLRSTNAPVVDGDKTPGEKKMKKTGSSLHRAVLERLEVKKAMTDLS
ncbi:hypothetical protein C0995_007976 [Termitomyces sp. Mi166|nr:hypothetical protein C0995_007976 [Termitomyces sp. Mi166\